MISCVSAVLLFKMLTSHGFKLRAIEKASQSPARLVPAEPSKLEEGLGYTIAAISSKH